MKSTMLSGLLMAAAVCLSLTVFAQWSTNPAVNNVICNLSGEQAIPKIATCPNGDTYIGYFSNESGNYNVRLQRLDALGNILWAPNGLLISSHPQETWLTDWDMTCDAANHAILAFNDIRTGSTNVVAYRISPTGSFVWGGDGILLSNTTAFNAAPKVVSTSAGNCVFAWSADNSIILQKITAAGSLQWGPAGILLSSVNRLTWPQLLPVGSDEVIVKYFSDSGPVNAPTRHVFAQRYSAAGTTLWGSAATISTAGGISAWTQIFPFINDGNDGFFIAWHDDRDNNQRASVFVQHVSNNGTVLFPANGVEVSNLSSMNHYYPKLALPTGSSDVYVFWNEMNALQSNWGIFSQKVDASGALQWGSGGLTLIPVGTTNVYPLEARKGTSDMILVYEEYTNAIDGMIKAMRISPAGTMLWTPAQKDICTVSSQKVHAVVNEFGNNQWIAAWEDNRSGNADIIAQNIQLDGSLGPAFSGTLSGTITLNGGSGNVTQVLVQAGSISTYPDATGFYSMTLLSGTYGVTASLPGYLPASQSNVVVQTNQVTTVNLSLNPVPEGYIQGNVSLVGGFGIITSVVVSAGTATTSPDNAGNYTLTVSPGTYPVIATLPTYIPDTVPNVTVANQQTVAGINLVLTLAPTNGLITGTVTLSGGSGNVTQVVVSAGGGVATTNPNAQGFYTLDLPAGNYDVTASLSGYIPQMLIGIPVVVNQTTANVDFTLIPEAGSGNIQGHVAITGEPADVTLTDIVAGGFSAHPDASGNYSVVVPSGTYSVTASHPYTNAITTQGVIVASGQATTGVDFLLTVDKADMICKAVDNFGSALYGVEVEIEGPGGPYSGTIVNDSLVFLRVPYGWYEGMATYIGAVPSSTDTTINAQNHHLVFEFYINGSADREEKPAPRIHPNPVTDQFRLIYSDGRYPVVKAALMLTSDGKPVKVHTARLVQGKATDVSGLPSGIYFLRIQTESNNYTLKLIKQ